MLYLSGQTGDVNGQLKQGFEAQARQTMENIGAVLKERGFGFADVVKCTVMLSDTSGQHSRCRVILSIRCLSCEGNA